ncbi:hypothetical protein NM09_02195 [Vibrio caribbeanicus]|uniref:Uncharacterized protein n=1 Tax=Vibrio caribbeanicus TaxID=701175 RepID=A0ACC4P284_9VIBR|nr:hypothetical protein NM09_02195 [Vibrio caribbeanicus]
MHKDYRTYQPRHLKIRNPDATNIGVSPFLSNQQVRDSAGIAKKLKALIPEEHVFELIEADGCSINSLTPALSLALQT